MKVILVPIDFSADSINALEHGIKFANRIGANVKMLHVEQSKTFETPFYFRDLENFTGKTSKDFMNLVLYRYQRKITHKLNYQIVNGNVATEIATIAEQEKVKYIIMGTHGTSGENSSWMGSNAFKVVTSSPCPVITIRNGFIRDSVKRIVLPIDASKHTRRKLQATADIALAFDSEIFVIGVTETSMEDILRKVESWVSQTVDYLNQRKIKNSSVMIRGSNITDMTIDYAKSVDAELITIMTDQGQHPVSLLLGPYAQHMVNNSPIPVLTIRPN